MLRVTDRGRNRGDRLGGLMMLLAVIGAGVLLLIVARMAFFGFDMPDWMDYCAQGTITNETNEDGDETVTFDMGEVFVCNATLEHSPANDAAFHQDDTPADFHGDFVSFVAGAAETTAAAAECPTDELERFSGDEYVEFVRGQLAAQYGVDETQIDVQPGRVGRTDAETQDELREALESYANRRDPEDPDREYEALDIEYFSGDGSAVEDSCWRVPGGEDLDSLESVGLPEPEQR